MGFCSKVARAFTKLISKQRPDANREQGIALIAVLWTLALLSIIVAALSLETRSDTRIARNVAEGAVVRAAADAGIQRAILNIDASSNSPTEAGRFQTDGTVYVWRFANCMVRISVEDETGKISLNQASEILLIALFRSVGIDAAKSHTLADAILDYRDEDDLPRANGAEETEYRSAGLKWGPKNAAFQLVEELHQVLGMTAKIYGQVAPHMTIYSIGAGVNPTRAGERLMTLLREAGFKYFAGSQAISAYLVRAEAKSETGAKFVRQAVIQVTSGTNGLKILSWGQGDEE